MPFGPGVMVSDTNWFVVTEMFRACNVGFVLVS